MNSRRSIASTPALALVCACFAAHQALILPRSVAVAEFARAAGKEMRFDPELDEMKRLDMRVVAASMGYELSPRESWRGSSVLRHPVTDDKIIVKLAPDGHYLYFSVRDDRDNGTIIDFLGRRKNLSLGAIRKELRPWLGTPVTPVPLFEPLVKTSKDRLRVEAAYAKMADAVRHPYLETTRGIPAELIARPRFVGRIRIDGRGNAVFPHFDDDGLCGYEIRGPEYKGFASGGTKGLWSSNSLPADQRSVITESAINGLSYAALFADDRTRYLSVAGKLNPKQPELIRGAIARICHAVVLAHNRR